MEFRDFASKEALEFAERLTKAATAAATAAAQAATQAATQRVTEESTRTIEAVRRDLAAARERGDAAEHAHAQEARARTAAEAELQDVRRVLDDTIAESERLSRTLSETLAERAVLQERVTSAQALADAAENQRQTLSTLYKGSTVRVESLEKAQAEHERALAAMTAETEQLREATLSGDALLDRIVEGFELLAGSANIADLLVALAEALAAQFNRVALFRVRGNKLEGTYQAGFDLGTDIAKVVIPLGMDSLLARAVASGCIEGLESGTVDSAKAPFGGTPSIAYALPVVAEQETFGILYVDSGAEPTAPELAAAHAWKGRYAEILLRHGVAQLLRLTSELRTLKELREHAARLLNHVVDMYGADGESGLTGAELHARLVENVDCARRLYQQRAAIEGPGAAGLLEEQLARVLESEAGTPFGDALAAVVGTDARVAS